MLPQQAAIVVPDRVPTLLEGDEPGIEGVALGAADDLAAAPAMKRRQQVYRVGDLQGLDVRPDRRPAQLAETRQPAVVDLPAAPAEQQPKQGQKPDDRPAGPCPADQDLPAVASNAGLLTGPADAFNGFVTTFAPDAVGRRVALIRPKECGRPIRHEVVTATGQDDVASCAGPDGISLSVPKMRSSPPTRSLHNGGVLDRCRRQNRTRKDSRRRPRCSACCPPPIPSPVRHPGRWADQCRPASHDYQLKPKPPILAARCRQNAGVMALMFSL